MYSHFLGDKPLLFQGGLSQQESFNKRYLIRRRKRHWTTMEVYFLQVLTSLELWPSSDVGATTIAFLQVSSFLWSSSFFLLALI
jgi:hypothetical protein